MNTPTDPDSLRLPVSQRLARWASTAWRTYRQPRVIVMLFLGFSAGLPFLLVFSTLSAWLYESGVEKATIGFFSWVGILFSVKVFWAPVVDQLRLPLITRWLGQRRGWLLLGQVGIALSLFFLSQVNPHTHLEQVAWLALLIAFCSATQDICVDAYRIESGEDKDQGAMAASYILGYRLALLVAGAGALYLAEFYDWRLTYQVMAACMLVGIITTLLIREPVIPQRASASQHFVHWLKHAAIDPFVDFFRRNGLHHALVLLLFIGVYRVGDIIMGVMANPFYLELGFSKDEIASVAKVFGFFMTILGSFAGGVYVARAGLMKPLLFGAILAASTNLLFAMMAVSGQADVAWLTVVISAENFSAGFATVAFIAYLSSLTSRSYTATQYALFSSLMTLPGKFVGGFSGMVVEQSGYAFFFTYAAVLGVPAILLVLYLMYSNLHHLSATKPVPEKEKAA